MPGSSPEYMREYRERNQEYTKLNRTRNKARQRAYSMLAARHDAEFQKLLADQLKKIRLEDNDGAR
jgi:ribosomal protein L20A (L18A)